jgi:Restriction endonuclease
MDSPGGGVASKQVGAGTGGRDPELLPTPSLTPDHFEDFTEALLHRQRFVAGPARRLVEVSRWGRRGDKQDGIDFVGAYDDGKTVTWQCKRVDELTPADVRKYIKEDAYTADEHVLVFSGLAKPKARAEVLKVQGWSLLDQRDLGQLVHDLPLHRARTLLEQFWDPAVRRAFLPVAGIDAFLGLDEHFAPTLDTVAVLHHRARSGRGGSSDRADHRPGRPRQEQACPGGTPSRRGRPPDRPGAGTPGTSAAGFGSAGRTAERSCSHPH